MRKIIIDFSDYSWWELSPGICICCNNCPCNYESPNNNGPRCSLNYEIYNIGPNDLSPDCKLVNIRYTKDDKPGHTHSYAKLKVFEKYDDAREAIYGKRIHPKGKI